MLWKEKDPLKRPLKRMICSPLDTAPFLLHFPAGTQLGTSLRNFMTLSTDCFATSAAYARKMHADILYCDPLQIPERKLTNTYKSYKYMCANSRYIYRCLHLKSCNRTGASSEANSMKDTYHVSGRKP